MNTYTQGVFIATLTERTERKQYPNHPYLVVYSQLQPKSKTSPVKHKAQIVYMDYNRALAAMQEWVDRNHEYHTQRLARKQTVPASEHYKVGDILVNTWGWEQTNVDFYRVTDVLAKSIRVRKVRTVISERSFMSGEATPGEEFHGDTEYLLRVRMGGELSQPERYYYIRKWDGKPQYCSWYA